MVGEVVDRRVHAAEQRAQDVQRALQQAHVPHHARARARAVRPASHAQGQQHAVRDGRGPDDVGRFRCGDAGAGDDDPGGLGAGGRVWSRCA